MKNNLKNIYLNHFAVQLKHNVINQLYFDWKKKNGNAAGILTHLSEAAGKTAVIPRKAERDRKPSSPAFHFSNLKKD